MHTTFPILLSIAAISMMGCRASQPPGSDQHATSDLTFTVPVIRILDEDDAERIANNLVTQGKLETVVSIPKGQTTLKHILDRVSASTGAKITVNWAALELVGIEQNAPLWVGMSHLSGDYLLRLALDYVSADAFDDDKIGFSFIDGLVVISTRRDLKSETNTGIYNIAWYILPSDRMQRWLYRKESRAEQLAAVNLQRNNLLNRIEPGFDLNEALSGTSSGGPARRQEGQGGLFGDKKTLNISIESDEQQINNRADELIELIQTTVGDPDEWLDEESTIATIKDKLVIKTTRKNHIEIEKLFSGLYRSKAQQFYNQARLIEVYLLLDEAESYRLKQKYGQALSLVEKARRVDPGNAEAWALKSIITETLSR